MKKAILIAMAVLFCGLNGSAQLPVWSFAAVGNSIAEAYGITYDQEGNFYVTGYFSGALELDDIYLESAGGKDVFYAKFNTTGTLQWVKSAGGPGDDEGLSVITDGSGNIFLAGNFTDAFTIASQVIHSEGQRDVFIAKMDTSGALLWLKTGNGVADDYFLGKCISYDNGVLAVTGTFGSFIDSTVSFTYRTGSLTTLYPHSDVFNLTIDASTGDLISMHQGGGNSEENAISISIDSGNVTATGMTNSFKYYLDLDTFFTLNYTNSIYLTSFRATGEINWLTGICITTFGDVGGGISAQADDGSVFIVGSLYNTDIRVNSTVVGNHIGDLDIFLSKFSPTGNHMWTKVVGGYSFDAGVFLSIDSFSNVYITGSYNYQCIFGPDTLQSEGGPDVFVAKYDKEGNFQWVLSGGGSGFSEGRSIAVSPSGDEIYLAGRYSGPFTLGSYSFDGPATGTDMFVARIAQPLSVNSSLPPQAQVVVYPNPSSGKVKISFETGSFSEITLKDMAGRTVYHSAIPVGAAVFYPDLSQLTNGVYLLQLKGSQAAYSQKLILQH